MNPAIRECQVIPFFVNGLVDAISIADNDSGIILQELDCTAGIPPFLILEQDNGRRGFILAGNPYPHIAFGSGGSSIAVDLAGGFIRLYDMALQQLIMHSFVKPPKIPVTCFDHPLAHQLPGQVDAVTFEFH